jgi:hypothetical protein
MNPLAVLTRKAAKPYTCCECGRTIAKGERHETWQGAHEGMLATMRTCALCAAVRWHWFKKNGKNHGKIEATRLVVYVIGDLRASQVAAAKGDNEAIIKAYALKHGVQAGETLT